MLPLLSSIALFFFFSLAVKSPYLCKDKTFFFPNSFILYLFSFAVRRLPFAVFVTPITYLIQLSYFFIQHRATELFFTLCQWGWSPQRRQRELCNAKFEILCVLTKTQSLPLLIYARIEPLCLCVSVFNNLRNFISYSSICKEFRR